MKRVNALSGQLQGSFRLEQVVHVVNKCASENESADNIAPHITECVCFIHTNTIRRQALCLIYKSTFQAWLIVPRKAIHIARRWAVSGCRRTDQHSAPDVATRAAITSIDPGKHERKISTGYLREHKFPMICRYV
jgi:hypothetical protein